MCSAILFRVRTSSSASASRIEFVNGVGLCVGVGSVQSLLRAERSFQGSVAVKTAPSHTASTSRAAPNVLSFHCKVSSSTRTKIDNNAEKSCGVGVGLHLGSSSPIVWYVTLLDSAKAKPRSKERQRDNTTCARPIRNGQTVSLHTKLRIKIAMLDVGCHVGCADPRT